MSDQLKKLHEERLSVWEGSKAIIDRAEAESREFTSEEHDEYKRRNDSYDKLTERIEVLTTRDEREREADKSRSEVERYIRPEQDRPQPDGNSEEQKMVDWFRSKPRQGEGFEIGHRGSLDISRAGNRNVVRTGLVVGTASAGGATVPTGFIPKLYEHLIENSAIRRTRAQVLVTGNGEALIFPKTLTHPAAGTIVSEGALINENDPTFGQGTLNAYKYANAIQVSNELIQDTAIDLLEYIARRAGEALGNGAGTDYITGSGSNKPQGVISGAGTIHQISGTAANYGPTADNLIDLFYAVTDPYAQNGEWLMRRATLGLVRKLKDNNGQYLWQPALIAGEPETILGHPVHTDPNVPAAGSAATSVAFGDFSRFLIRDVNGIRFERSDDYAFLNDLVTFRVILRTDSDYTDTTGAIGTFKGTAA